MPYNLPDWAIKQIVDFWAPRQIEVQLKIGQNAKILIFIGLQSNEAFKWAKEIMPRYFDISPAVEFPYLIN